MTLSLHVHKRPIDGSEYHAIVAFLKWQGKGSLLVIDPLVLSETCGTPKVVVKNEGKTVAIGMFELIKWLEKNGLILI